MCHQLIWFSTLLPWPKTQAQLASPTAIDAPSWSNRSAESEGVDPLGHLLELEKKQSTQKKGWLLEWMNQMTALCFPKKVTVSLSCCFVSVSSANIPLFILQCVISSADNQIAANHCSSSQESPFTMDSRISPWFQPAFFGPTPHPTPTFRFPVICNSEPGGGKPTISP